MFTQHKLWALTERMRSLPANVSSLCTLAGSGRRSLPSLLRNAQGSCSAPFYLQPLRGEIVSELNENRRSSMVQLRLLHALRDVADRG